MKKLIKILDSLPKWLAGLLICLAFIITYNLANNIYLVPAPNPVLTIIDQIPFIDWTIIIYLSIFFEILIGLYIGLKYYQGQALLSGALLFSLHFLFFILYPVEFPRIDINPSETWTWLYQIMWSIDQPKNCFPSLHVGIAFLTALLVNQYSRKLGGMFWIWALLISISTLTTKQHYFVDVLGGIGSGTFVYLLSGKPNGLRQRIS